jgi:hypothetical protein
MELSLLTSAGVSRAAEAALAMANADYLQRASIGDIENGGQKTTGEMRKLL